MKHMSLLPFLTNNEYTMWDQFYILLIQLGLANDTAENYVKATCRLAWKP